MALTEMAGGLAGATPYGAAIGAAAGVLQSALADTPTSLTSGAGSYQSGPLVIGAKQVGGKGNSAGATSATQSQTPQETSPGAVKQQQTALYVVAGVVVAVLVAVVALAGGRRKKRKER